MEGAAALGASGEPLLRNAGDCVHAAPARRAASSTPSGRCTSPTCRARWRRARGCAPASRRGGCCSRTGAPCGAARARADGARDGRPPRPSRSAPARWCWPAAPSARPSCCCARASRQRPRRPQPPHPPRVLGRRPLRRGGARLGRRDAELLRRRVAGPWASCSRRPSRRSRSAPSGCRARGREHQSGCSPSTPRLERRPPLGPLRGPRGARARAARCGSPTAAARGGRELVFGIARAAEIYVRRRRDRGLSADRRRSRCCAPATSADAGGARPAPGDAAPRGLPPDGHGAAWPPTPATGVIAPDGAVHGAEDLYVADASLLPTLARRQPDDDRHRVRVADLARAGAGATRLARRRPSAARWATSPRRAAPVQALDATAPRASSPRRPRPSRERGPGAD